MRRLSQLFLLLVLLLQYQLWLGEQNRFDSRRMERELATMELELQQLQQRNSRLRAEVRDLKQGVAAYEELARSDLGYIREGEIFFRVVE
ncbi:MAG TPA: cell division protein FtsB [Gammaproteobacteria bacterium]|nr:cell division protein FtsB [Gammaproteobacteria bacterium]